jgi:dihydrofolate reductase
MTISIIVAVTNNGVIGRNNDIPWYLPEDLKWFKKHTLNHAIVMGRKCFESIGRALPKRMNIVITRDVFYLASGCVIVHSLSEAIQVARSEGETEVFIIGGGEIYHQAIDICTKIYLTQVDADIEGDVFFQAPLIEEWNVTFEEKHVKDEKNEYDFIFKVLERK